MAYHFQILVPLQKGTYFAAQLQWEYFLVPKIQVTPDVRLHSSFLLCQIHLSHIPIIIHQMFNFITHLIFEMIYYIWNDILYMHVVKKRSCKRRWKLDYLLTFCTCWVKVRRLPLNLRTLSRLSVFIEDAKSSSRGYISPSIPFTCWTQESLGMRS